jgi:hypothetical protein
MIDSAYEIQKKAKYTNYIKHDNGTVELCFAKNEFHPKKEQKYKIDYDLILKVGDMKEKGMTNKEVAQRIEPRAFRDKNDEPADPSSAIRKVSNYYKTYRKLVEDGYKKITTV